MNVLFAADRKVVSEIPHTLTFDRSYKSVRICALSTDQGKTTGYFERTITRRDTEVVIGQDDDRLTALAEKAVEVTAKIQSKVVYAAAAMMHGESTDISAAAAASASDDFRAAMDEALPLWVLDRAAEPADLDADMQSYAAIAVRAATKAVEMADRAAATASPLTKAKAWNYFNFAMSKGKALEGYNLMKNSTKARDGRPKLVDEVGAMMASLAGQIKADPSIPKTLRTMAVSAKPIAYWRLAQIFPFQIAGSPACDVILKGLGSIDHASGANGNGAPGFGAILARADFPENRMDRLVTASGETLATLIDEAWRFAEAKGAVRADWRSLAGLLIADTMGDDEAAAWCQRRLALEYVRTPVIG